MEIELPEGAGVVGLAPNGGRTAGPEEENDD